MKSEAEVLAEIMLTFGKRVDMRIWRNNTGAARDISGRVIRFGVTGQADISGIWWPSGRRLEIECKSSTGRQTPEQKNFQRMIETMGGIYVLARSVEDCAAVFGPAPMVGPAWMVQP